MRILDLFGTQQLTAHDVTCLKTMYPNLYDDLAGELVKYTLNTYRPDKPMPRRIQMMLAMFLEAQTIKLEQLKAYKDHDTTAAAKKASADQAAPTISQSESK